MSTERRPRMRRACRAADCEAEGQQTTPTLRPRRQWRQRRSSKTRLLQMHRLPRMPRMPRPRVGLIRSDPERSSAELKSIVEALIFASPEPAHAEGAVQAA